MLKKELSQKFGNYLIVNPGSTAVKYSLFDHEKKLILKEKFNLDDNIKKIFLMKLEDRYGKIQKIGIRIVHGLDLHGPIKIDKKVEKKIKEAVDFAPIHNKIALNEIQELRSKIFADIIAIFDTDFHRTILEINYTYPIDLKYRDKYHIRKYGFHGIANQSILTQLKEKNKKIPKKIILAHLGGGSSLSAVLDGKSIANTMGLTPISGLMMVTRAGDVDSDLDKILSKKLNRSIDYISDILSQKSGFYGMTGNKDIKEIFDKAELDIKNQIKSKERLAFELYLNILMKKIFSFYFLLGGLDMLVLSGGTGSANNFLKKEILKKMKILNLDSKNIIQMETIEDNEILNKI